MGIVDTGVDNPDLNAGSNKTLIMELVHPSHSMRCIKGKSILPPCFFGIHGFLRLAESMAGNKNRVFHTRSSI